MERDALLAHGTSFLLQDRLMNCSDYSTAWVCRSCGSLISLGYEEIVGETGGDGTGGEYCRICRSEETHHKGEGVVVNVPGSVKLNTKGKNMDVIAVPYVFRYVSGLGCFGDLSSDLTGLLLALRRNGCDGYPAECQCCIGQIGSTIIHN
jgi:DNA-directed RNA polymerase I subunit RPA2